MDTTYIIAALRKIEEEARELRLVVEQGQGERPFHIEDEAPQVTPPPRDPVAQSLTTLVTPRQLGMIRALGREADVDVEHECQARLGCKTEELSKRAASSFIEHLQAVKQGQVRRAS